MIEAKAICRYLLETDEVPPGTPPDPIEQAKDFLYNQQHTHEMLRQAVGMYRDRKARRTHPDGSFDKHGRWYPSSSERQACCDSIRSPSVSYPYSLMLHCRTVDHIARRHGLDPGLLRTYIKKGV